MERGWRPAVCGRLEDVHLLRFDTTMAQVQIPLIEKIPNDRRS
jgi:hypothetical protein